MKLFRIVKSKYRFELSGMGASKSGNRWNSKGFEIIYTSESRALAVLELMAHLPLELFQKDFVILEIEVPDSIPIQEIMQEELADNWKVFPPSHKTQEMGNHFLTQGEKCILKVPSVMVPREFNYLINPKHVQFDQIKICEVLDLEMDKRLA